jgi:hypothetical protein
MDRRHRPFWALVTALALVVGTIFPDRASARESGARIVESHAPSTTAIPAFWTFSVHTVQRAGSPRHTAAQQLWMASRFPTLDVSTSTAPVDAETRSLSARDARAFTYDATAPPAIVVL